MDNLDRTNLLAMCQLLLKPLASLFLKAGLTWREFSEVSKLVFVDAASKNFGIKGRPTNKSRVANLTGIDRKKVSELQQQLANPKPIEIAKSTDATRILSGWFQDKDFLDADGKPRELDFESKGHDFVELAHRYASDISVQTLLKELISTGSVVRQPNQKLYAAKRFYMPVKIDAEWMRMAGTFFHDLGVNINYNLDAGQDKPSRFLGYATEHHINPEAVGEFKEFMEVQGQEFLQKVDNWLNENRIEVENGNDHSRVRLGVGLFTIQGDVDN